jgi:hypothetical protein
MSASIPIEIANAGILDPADQSSPPYSDWRPRVSIEWSREHAASFLEGRMRQPDGGNVAGDLDSWPWNLPTPATRLYFMILLCRGMLRSGQATAFLVFFKLNALNISTLRQKYLIFGDLEALSVP